MKTKLKILKILTGGFVTLLFFTFLNCNDMECPNYPPGGKLIYEFHEEDSLKIPYTGKDTLTFLRTKNSKKDTVIFIGQGKKYSLQYLRQEDEMTPCEYRVFARKFKIDYVVQNEPDLKFRFTCIATGGMGDDIIIFIRGFDFELGFWLWEELTDYHKYITFGNKTYYSVNYFVGDYNDLSNLLYYNFEYGIIRFYFDNGTETLDLITK